MSYERYSKIFLPTIDTVLCRGTSIFAHPQGDEARDNRVLLIMPNYYWNIVRDKQFSGIIGYEPGLDDLFKKTSEDVGTFMKKNKIGGEHLIQRDNGVDIKFIEVPCENPTNLVRTIEAEIRKGNAGRIVDTAREDSIFVVQACLNMSQADLVFNGIHYEVPRYKGLGPEIADQYLVEINSTADPERYAALEAAIRTEEIKREEDDSDRIFYIPVETYSEITGVRAIANQFLVMTDLSNPRMPKAIAYRMKFDQRRFERVDLDARVAEISHLWRPGQPFDIRQKLALDILLDDDIGLPFVVGGKQTGKTSLAMAAFESKVFGRGRNKDKMETMITLIKSGLSKDINYSQLLSALTSFQASFMEQEIGINPFDELCESVLKRTYLKDKTSLLTKSTQTDEERKRDAVFPPQTPVFRLMHPKDEEGEKFPGFTIRDECQNERTYMMKLFKERRRMGAKYALLGDLYDQITRPGLDMYWNGLLLCLYKNMGLENVACVTLTEKWSDRQLK